ncbi:2945_t:CDS:2 [Racocetra fulgida]|uniref:2945_t:CDS:1 n=1 Tax=Racocetra fulgida TaxID=60492 RepID=A0A9N9IX80_9GLOM|nr:2945_t:CDS:2 [Racocetra fulgida]
MFKNILREVKEEKEVYVAMMVEESEEKKYNNLGKKKTVIHCQKLAKMGCNRRAEMDYVDKLNRLDTCDTIRAETDDHNTFSNPALRIVLMEKLTSNPAFKKELTLKSMKIKEFELKRSRIKKSKLKKNP